MISLVNVIFLSSFVLIIFLFSVPISSYFSQDDFFHFRTIMDKNFTDIPSFFIDRNYESGFFRPLSRQTYNLIMYKVFNLNPLPYHLVNLILIGILNILTFLIVRKITNNVKIAILSVVIFAISAVHSIEIYYLSSVQTLLASMFIGFSTYLFLSDKKVYSVIFFILGLLCHEIAIVLPGFILMVSILKGEKIKNIFLNLFPFATISVIYLILASSFVNLPKQAVYQPIFHPKAIINSLSWYTLWSFNFPEILSDFVGSNFSLNPNFIKWYGEYFRIVSISFIIILSVLFLFIVKFYRQIFKKELAYFLGGFIISIGPFLFFPQHKFIYYLSFTTVWFSAILALVFVSGGKTLFGKVLIVIAILSLLLISYQTTGLYKSTYWAAKRAEAAKFLAADIKKTFPNIEKNSIFYIKNDPDYPNIASEWGNSSKQAFYILSGADAFKLIYNDSTVTVYYEDIKKPPEDTKDIKIYTAKFPY